ncbi:maltokinase N-terminal cap-like domain-containing protein [Nocardioides sp. Iso805N]|uniref:maltokinase N-terminal cap-like domain-containing protein n=1 Tax=Nocardioides sp. Iso805N TaxID=1283287 RepID=UPI0003803120|nr:hypothetical protein [Nocardioides sp. Iso805N]
MAVIHKATISPTKGEVLERILGAPVTVRGAYRFDDPDGEVGVEGFILTVGGATRHAVLTYRGTPLDGAEEHLACTMEHSVLGTRWVYDGLGDPVARGCFGRALRGQQSQAEEEVWDGAEHLDTREPTVRIATVAGQPAPAGAVPVIVTELAEQDTAGARLTATWDGGTAVIATLS